jgi:two-component system, response regulator
LDYLFCTNKYADGDPDDLPQLTLLDVKLPKMDGPEVLRRVCANKRTCLLPVVILTSSKEEQNIITGYKHGANSYVRKSVDFTQFERSVRQLSSYWLGLNEAPPR